MDAPSPSWRTRGLVSTALVLLVALVFGQTAGFDFVNYDDDVHVYENPRVLGGLTKDNIVWSFTIHGPGQWHPLNYLTHQAVVEWFGAQAGPHHVANVLIHALAAAAWFLALLALTGRGWSAAVTAALFAVHPLSVESVAWVCERRDVLCALFWALTLWAYAGFARHGGVCRWSLVTLAFAASLMSKPMAVTLPCVLLLLDAWPLTRSNAGKSWGSLLLEKVPWFAMSGVASSLTFLCQPQAVVSLQVIDFGARLLNALASYAIYLGKALVPSGLAAFYPHPAIVGGSGLGSLRVQALLAVPVLAGLSVLAWKSRKRAGFFTVGWCWYLGVLFPVIGLFQAGEQARGDRFAYLPLVGIFWALSCAVELAVQRGFIRQSRATVIATTVVLGLAVLAWRQTSHWQNGTTLFQRALDVTENNYVAHQNLGRLLQDQGREAQAVEHYRLAIAIAPRPEALNNWGVILGGQGQWDQAREYFQRAVSLRASYADGWYNLGAALELQSRPDPGAALQAYERALRHAPRDADTREAVARLRGARR